MKHLGTKTVESTSSHIIIKVCLPLADVGMLLRDTLIAIRFNVVDEDTTVGKMNGINEDLAQTSVIFGLELALKKEVQAASE